LRTQIIGLLSIGLIEETILNTTYAKWSHKNKLLIKLLAAIALSSKNNKALQAQPLSSGKKTKALQKGYSNSP
jgi:hypothetical protein